MRNILIIIGVLLGMFSGVQAQSVHFTYYDFAPLSYNPGLTGGFSGTYRVQAIYRDQWFSVSSAGRFSTANIAVDLPVIRGFRKQDWVGLGVNVFQDQSSQFNLKTVKFASSLAYHLALDKKQKNVLSIGIGQGNASRSLKTKNRVLITERYLKSGSSSYIDPDTKLIAAESKKINDWSIGLVYSGIVNKDNQIKVGFSVGNIYNKNQSFLEGSSDILKLHYAAFASYDMPISSVLYLTPQLFYQRTRNNQELLLQGRMSYELNADKGIFANAGLGYRVGDAVQVLMGADYKDWKFGMSFDLTASKFTPATNGFGAFELAVAYIGKVYKKPKVKPTMVCPRL